MSSRDALPDDPERGGGRSPVETRVGQRWYHKIDLPDGSTTPGVFDSRGTARLVRWPAGLQGGRCLDIGTCDGFWAFEMERRGAGEVVAIDVDDPDHLDWSWDGGRRRHPEPALAARRGERFEAAHRALGSRTKRLGCSVYDLDARVHGRFDVVFCGTLLLHFRDPVRALERMREVCAGELVLVECVDAVLDLVARRVPCARLSPTPEQWRRVNRAGLLRMLELAGFEVRWVSRRFLTPFGPEIARPRSGWRRVLAAGRAAGGNLLRRMATVPVLGPAAGLVLGTYDVSVRARPADGQPLGSNGGPGPEVDP